MKPADLKTLRASLGLTQTELAERLGLTRDGIARMENGGIPIRRVTELALEHLSCRRKRK